MNKERNGCHSHSLFGAIGSQDVQVPPIPNWPTNWLAWDKCWVQKYNLLTISIDVYIFLWHYQLDIDHPLQVSSLCFINVSTVLVCVANWKLPQFSFCSQQFLHSCSLKIWSFLASKRQIQARVFSSISHVTFTFLGSEKSDFKLWQSSPFWLSNFHKVCQKFTKT